MACRPLTRALRLPLTALTVIAALAVPLTLSATPASADSLTHQIADAQRQLAALNRAGEQAAERYDAASVALAAADRAAAAAQARLAAARSRLAALRGSVDAFAAAAYQGEGLTNLQVLTESSPGQFLARMNSLSVISRSQTETLVALAAAREQQQAAAAAAARAAARQRAITATLQRQKDQIERDAAGVQALLGRLVAKEAAIERAARLAAERAAAARRAAELAAARQAAAAAAALAAQQAAIQQAAQTFATQPVTPPPVVTGSGGAPVAVQWAYREIGKPYVWGAAGPDAFDCSGLTQYVWGKAGVYLAHYTGSQWTEGTHVPQSQLQPGDLVFFYPDISHVGIYVGGGMMIDAPHSGADVREEPVWWAEYQGAVRPY